MSTRSARAGLLLCMLAIAPFPAHAKDPAKKSPPAQEVVCGHDLMTQQELAEQRAKMRSAKTQRERDAIRAANHEAMLKRAQERGVTLNPAGCPRGGTGMGRGRGGSGMGTGGAGSEIQPQP